MSAADRMVVRTRDGSYRSFPRRTALGMISRGQATVAPTVTPQAAPADLDPLGPHGDEYQDKLDQHLTDMAVALDIPVEVLIPTDDGVNHWSAADPSADMAAALEAPGTQDSPAPITTVEIEITTTPETAELLGLIPASELPEPPRGNASRQEWADYAQDHLRIEVTSAMSRTKIREAVQEQLQSLDRLPQPALSGGRLETPEDEPAAERLADDEDPGTE